MHRLKAFIIFLLLQNIRHTKIREELNATKLLLDALNQAESMCILDDLNQRMSGARVVRKKFFAMKKIETDVAIATKLLEGFFTDSCDTTVLLTGDTDLAPAVRRAKELFPKRTILFAFPYKRKNKELEKLCPGSFKISRKQYLNHQFPNPVILENGRKIYKPNSW